MELWVVLYFIQMLIATGAVFYYYGNRPLVHKWILNTIAGKNRKQLAKVFPYLNLSFSHPVKTIILPTVIGVGIYLFFLSILGWFGPTQFPLLFAIGSIFLNPILEEFFYRGIFFGAFLVVMIPFILKTRFNVSLNKNNYLVFATIFQAIIFAWSHDMFGAVVITSQSFLYRFIGGLIYGGIYWKNGRNIIPAIFAHAGWNAAVQLVAIFI